MKYNENTEKTEEILHLAATYQKLNDAGRDKLDRTIQEFVAGNCVILNHKMPAKNEEEEG